MKHGDLAVAGNLFHESHVVFDDDDAVFAGQRDQELARAVGFFIGHAGGGFVQRAIRDGENRVLFSGYATAHFKLFIFIVAAFIAAVGGALYVPQVGIINPSEMTPDKSLEAVVWCAVGGRATLVGPIIGAISVNALKSWASRAAPDYWLVILGGMFVIVVLLLPGGIVSIPARLKALWQRFTKKPDDPEPPKPPAPPQEPAVTPATTPST